VRGREGNKRTVRIARKKANAADVPLENHSRPRKGECRGARGKKRGEGEGEDGRNAEKMAGKDTTDLDLS